MPETGVATTLKQVRRELDDMSGWRLTSPFTAREMERYETLLTYERLLMLEVE